MKPLIRAVPHKLEKPLRTQTAFSVRSVRSTVRAKEHATITRSASSIAPGFKYHSATKPFSAHHQFQLQTARWLCNNRNTTSIAPSVPSKLESTTKKAPSAVVPAEEEEEVEVEAEETNMDELGDAILYKVWGINPEEEEVEEEFVAEGEEEDGEVVSVKEFVNRYIEGKLDLSSDAATQGKEGTEGRGVVHGKHILHLAVRENLIEQCKTLIETLHFDVNSKDESGITPLHLSALHTDCTLFHYLLAKGADIDATADSGERLIHVAAVAGNIPLVTLLLQKNAKEAVAVTKEGCTPLHLAVEQNHSALCQLLIDAGAYVNIPDDKGEQPLHLAIEKDAKESIKVLLQNGADVNAFTKHKAHPFFQAVAENKLEIVKMIFEYGKPDLAISTTEGQNPIHVAADMSNLEMIQLLVAHGIQLDKGDNLGNTALHIATHNADSQVIELLLQLGIDVNVVNDHGEGALHTAVLKGHHEIVKLLIAKGANVNLAAQDKSTALHYALKEGQHDCAVALLDSNAVDVDAQDEEGNTPLHVAVKAGYFRWVEELIQRGASVNLPNNTKRTPLDFANLYKRKQCRKLLLQHHAISLNPSKPPYRPTVTSTATSKK